mmetsp:Transcript_7416/g.25345  ORF Transcript_7416/g.25345 Transcript_7416/m.25345 type:complete len:122 (+) Transcript_7416:976-1341(+)
MRSKRRGRRHGHSQEQHGEDAQGQSNYVNMGEKYDLGVRSAEERASASTGADDLRAGLAGDGRSASMRDGDQNARRAVGRASVSTGGVDGRARNVGEGACASTGCCDRYAEFVVEAETSDH